MISQPFPYCNLASVFHSDRMVIFGFSRDTPETGHCGASQIFHTIAKAAGLDQDITAHIGRHAFARHRQGCGSRGVVKEAARSRNPWYIAWSAHCSRSASALQAAPKAENDQWRDQRQQPRLRLMTPFLPTPRPGCAVQSAGDGDVEGAVGGDA
jgi:hypothetical protein